eukprot:2251592-Pyramimonas_sp.AAC.1
MRSRGVRIRGRRSSRPTSPSALMDSRTGQPEGPSRPRAAWAGMSCSRSSSRQPTRCTEEASARWASVFSE